MYCECLGTGLGTRTSVFEGPLRAVFEQGGGVESATMQDTKSVAVATRNLHT